MGTRARIALKLEDSTYISSYQHWDGYPGHLGFLLCTWWRDPEKVRRGIELGSASHWSFIIGARIGFKDSKNPQYGVQNVYHHRDRGESWSHCQYQTHPNIDNLIDNGFYACEEYLYLMKDGAWFYMENDSDTREFTPLWDRAVADYFERIARIKPKY